MPVNQMNGKTSTHKDIYEKYKFQYSIDPKLSSIELPRRHPPLERPSFNLFTHAPAAKPDKDWRMPLTQYRKAEKYPEHVATYEQSVLALSRRIRMSLPPCPAYRDSRTTSNSSLKQGVWGREKTTSAGTNIICGIVGQQTPSRGF
eukprot:GFUD01023150.1.p1 GENE.GFUD01023150.1~~GFUD01023150.1.p1  ORF type:complete len:146 (+),score=17.28 GFUD01023150.1:98-535(+)